jgi:hypothetical protein
LLWRQPMTPDRPGDGDPSKTRIATTYASALLVDGNIQYVRADSAET